MFIATGPCCRAPELPRDYQGANKFTPAPELPDASAFYNQRILTGLRPVLVSLISPNSAAGLPGIKKEQ